MNTKLRILVLGGYSEQVKSVATILAQNPAWEVWVASPHVKPLQRLILEIQSAPPYLTVHPYILDCQKANFKEMLQKSGATLVVDSTGSLTGQNYKIAQACIELNIHYLDLTDNRQFVTQISQLDELAKKNQVVVLSGASLLPGLSSVVVDTYAKRFAILREIDFGIAVGNKIENTEATVDSLLSYTGKPFQRLEGGRWKTVYGWQNLHQHYYGDNLGLRWHANCDIPELTLFPQRYPMLKTVVFHAGFEVSFFHWLLWHMSWLTRAHVIKDWAYFRKPLTFFSRCFRRLGTNNAGMYIRMRGSNYDYQPLEINWTLVAESGHAQYVAPATSSILVRKILEGSIAPGAQPCLGMFTLKEFDHAVSFWNIYHTVEEKEM